MKNTYHMPAIPECGKAQDHFAIYSTMEAWIADAETLKAGNFGSWTGQGTSKAIQYAKHGDLSQVAPSDKLLTELEGMVFVSRKFRVTDEVVGALPNVPAFLAGNPANMRLRRRTQTESAPLSIFVDLTTSAGIPADDVCKRGIAILALVRLLTNVRPCELYAMTGLGSYGHADYCAVRLDTAPLDLARAAHMLTSTTVARDLCYRLCNKVGGDSHRGNWPYADVSLQRKHGAAILSRVVHPGSEVLFMPPMHLTDDAVKTPVTWIKSMLKQYGGSTVEDDC